MSSVSLAMESMKETDRSECQHAVDLTGVLKMKSVNSHICSTSVCITCDTEAFG